jgi:hypothetical protein
MASRAASFSIFSLWASNSVPTPSVGDRIVWAGTVQIFSPLGTERFCGPEERHIQGAIVCLSSDVLRGRTHRMLEASALEIYIAGDLRFHVTVSPEAWKPTLRTKFDHRSAYDAGDIGRSSHWHRRNLDRKLVTGGERG